MIDITLGNTMEYINEGISLCRDVSGAYKTSEHRNKHYSGRKTAIIEHKSVGF